VVARAVWREIARGGQAWLDTRKALGAAIATRFPSVTALCRQSGLDPVSEAIPVRPAAHYHMGGVAVDDRGRSSVSGLWACGEVSATGLHGANRLASNSLLEGLAYARWIAEDIHGVAAGKPARPVMLDSPPGPGGDDSKALAGIRRLMTDAVGVVRDEATLTSAIAQLEQLAGQSRGRAADAALTGMMIAVAARKRRESRGAQCRSDYPALLPEPASHTRITLAEARAQASASRVQPSAREL
jgi:aspartate oxidase